MPNNELPTEWEKGLNNLQKPAWPLCHLAILLYITGDYRDFDSLFQDLPAPFETDKVTYENPQDLLLPYQDLFKNLEKVLKNEEENLSIPPILDEKKLPLDRFDGAVLWIKHEIVKKELESINTLLCGPCNCTLCCTGPEEDSKHEYFEIPLKHEELDLFSLPIVDTESSRKMTPDDDEELKIDGVAFYKRSPSIYHWENGWSLILGRKHSCPHLDERGRCAIYPVRPDICRRPQIFSYILEEVTDGETTEFVSRDAILAIWDCPYVRALKDAIIGYAELIGSELIFRENKM